jgi:hypothetical protein
MATGALREGLSSNYGMIWSAELAQWSHPTQLLQPREPVVGGCVVSPAAAL